MLDLSFLRKQPPAVLLQLGEGSEYLKRIANFRKRKRTLFVCRIQSVVPHLPAKALLLNIKQYNGKFGCITCKHPGRYSHSARQIRARLYEYWPSGTVAIREAHETRMFGRIGEHLEVVLSQNTWFPIGWQKIMSPFTAWCILKKEICAATLSSFVHMGGNAMVEWFAVSSSKMWPMHWSPSVAWIDWLFAKTFLHHRM